ncbi:MAG TPA: hypothetical protein VF834_05305 [Streptosporangiaceae bacterium]
MLGRGRWRWELWLGRVGMLGQVQQFSRVQCLGWLNQLTRLRPVGTHRLGLPGRYQGMSRLCRARSLDRPHPARRAGRIGLRRLPD